MPETWFFRDREAFAALALTVYEDWLGAHPEDHLRLLSLPSSTGEEPYSMAMALLDAGFPANRFRVDAVDISARALARAGHAVYGKNSFRGNELGFRDRHFEATAHGYRLSDAVRRQVQFQQGNLLAAGFLPGVESYDVIFCRNVLIYFDRAAQDRALTVLVRLLTPLHAKVNLIPFNPWPGAPYECSSNNRMHRFAEIVNDGGLSAPIRTPRGRDISAACGQLKSDSVRQKGQKVVL